MDEGLRVDQRAGAAGVVGERPGAVGQHPRVAQRRRQGLVGHLVPAVDQELPVVARHHRRGPAAGGRTALGDSGSTPRRPRSRRRHGSGAGLGLDRCRCRARWCRCRGPRRGKPPPGDPVRPRRTRARRCRPTPRSRRRRPPRPRRRRPPRRRGPGRVRPRRSCGPWAPARGPRPRTRRRRPSATVASRRCPGPPRAARSAGARRRAPGAGSSTCDAPMSGPAAARPVVGLCDVSRDVPDDASSPEQPATSTHPASSVRSRTLTRSPCRRHDTSRSRSGHESEGWKTPSTLPSGSPKMNRLPPG